MITLRKIKKRDKFLLFEYLKDECVKSSYVNLPPDLSLVDVENQMGKIKNNCYIICLDGIFIGLRYFWPKKDYLETGSWIAPNYQRNGYGSIAFSIFLKTLDKGAIVKSKPLNEKSRKFLEKNGFERCGKGFYFLETQ